MPCRKPAEAAALRLGWQESGSLHPDVSRAHRLCAPAVLQSASPGPARLPGPAGSQCAGLQQNVRLSCLADSQRKRKRKRKSKSKSKSKSNSNSKSESKSLSPSLCLPLPWLFHAPF